MKHILPLLLSLFTIHYSPFLVADELSLAGQWQVSLAPDTTEKTQSYPDTLPLPGTLDEARMGQAAVPNTIELNRHVTFNGTAWYQRAITIPENWRGQNITLTLERTRFTNIYLDGQLVATNNSLSTPHRATLLTNATPGTHRLTIAVNNDPKNYPMSFSHVWSDRIQTNWNGIIGQIKLTAQPPVSITDAQLHPDPKTRLLKIQLTTTNTTPAAATATLQFQINKLPPTTRQITIAPDKQHHLLSIPLPDKLPPWDEFNPATHTLKIQLTTTTAPAAQTLTLPIPHREVGTANRHFTINKLPTFLRGKMDGGVFPLTGYAPMDEAAWERHFRALQSAGINYVRFHSWCPPKAAFAAADKLGMYIQPELPAWARYNDPGLPEYLQAEAHRILREYGNHPSFIMLTLGNELSGDGPGRRQLVAELKQTDPRRLYAQGSNNNLDAPEPNDNDDFWTTSATFREGGRVVLNIELTRGSMLYNHLGHLNNQYPSATTHDYTRSTNRVNIPLISHETGQYLMFPDFDDIPKYTGVLTANPQVHQKRLLEKSGMAHLAEKFHHASGKLAEICYKEDMESVLRTPDMGGFALLDLQDYPGQGSGLVGMFNAFMEPKAFFTPEKFRQHNAPITPLLLLEKRTYTAADTLRATFKIAHYHNTPLENATATLTLTSTDGKILHQQKIPLPKQVAAGGLRTIAENLEIPLAKIPAPSQLKIRVAIDGTPWRNEYDIWLYPENITYKIPKKIEMTELLTPAHLRALHNGKTIFLLPRLHELGSSISGQFIANFWTIAFFKSYDGPGTLGLLLDPAHPLFKNFPTETHSNWQWFPMTRYGRPLILDKLPPDLSPIVQVIDNFETSRKLGLIFEAKVGKGKLLFTSINFLDHLDKPEVRQLMFSILRYMESPDFAPKTEITDEQLLNLFRKDTAPANIPDAQRPGLNG